MKLTDVVILDGARTAIGGFGGSLSSLSPADLGTCAAKEAITRSGVSAEASTTLCLATLFQPARQMPTWLATLA